jgi:hypothetical protein
MARLRAGDVDPAPIASKWVLMIKGVGFGLRIVALIASLRRIFEENG